MKIVEGEAIRTGDSFSGDSCVWFIRVEPYYGQDAPAARPYVKPLYAIVNDRFYPSLLPKGPDDFIKPLQLLAQRLRFVDLLVVARTILNG